MARDLEATKKTRLTLSLSLPLGKHTTYAVYVYTSAIADSPRCASSLRRVDAINFVSLARETLLNHSSRVSRFGRRIHPHSQDSSLSLSSLLRLEREREVDRHSVTPARARAAVMGRGNFCHTAVGARAKVAATSGRQTCVRYIGEFHGSLRGFA